MIGINRNVANGLHLTATNTNVPDIAGEDGKRDASAAPENQQNSRAALAIYPYAYSGNFAFSTVFKDFNPIVTEVRTVDKRSVHGSSSQSETRAALKALYQIGGMSQTTTCEVFR
jgi:hypothetical protein